MHSMYWLAIFFSSAMGRTVARLRVCADAQQGSRRYMEDFVDLRYEKDKNGNTVAFFAVFDGHGGKEAALFARNRMWSNLKRRTSFYSYCPKKVCKTISDVFLDTHESMWPHRGKSNGLLTVTSTFLMWY